MTFEVPLQNKYNLVKHTFLEEMYVEVRWQMNVIHSKAHSCEKHVPLGLDRLQRN